MVTRISRSPDETTALGERLGRDVQPGTVYGLVGDLGAGKTQFVRGFARGLGIVERVHSPTFTLVNEYRTGRIPCYHLDLYRLNDASDILAAGIQTYFSPADGITLIEWFDRAGQGVPVTGRLQVITFTIQSESERLITYEDPRS